MTKLSFRLGIFIVIVIFYFSQYLVRGAQFSEAVLNRALMKRKTTQKTITDRKKIEQLSIAKVLQAQFGLEQKCLFRPSPNVFKSCSLLRARGSVFYRPWFIGLLVCLP